MLKALQDLIDRALSGQVEQQADARKHGIELATAVLLVEVARADYDEDLTANETLFDLLKSRFHLTRQEAKLLIEEARAEADYAASLQSFTRQLHEQLSADEKLRIVEMLWQVALADREIDRHEDHLIRKLGGLLYVPHGDLIRIRNRVSENAGAAARPADQDKDDERELGQPAAKR